jgi:glutamine synthetase
MAKWSMDTAGSSCHIHTSLWDPATGEPLMVRRPGQRPSGLSTIGRQFLAGQLHAARQLAWCFAPYVNSYRRYVPDSWAPTAVVWGEDNRTCGFRHSSGTGSSRRVESRIPGADVNPYLALAAAIAGGLWGIEHELELGAGFTGNAYRGATDVPRIPSTLVEAIDELEAARSRRGVRSGGPPPPAEHGPPGVGERQPAWSHRLGAAARNFERI